MATKRKVWIILDSLVPIILNNVEGCVVDIGIGTSTVVFHDHAIKFKKSHYTCDISKKKCRWARTVPELEVFEGQSLDFIKQFPNISVALVFLDGDHRYATVVEEINFFLTKLSPGGIIFLHDTMPRSWDQVYSHACYDSYLVRQEMEKRKDLMTFTWPYTALALGLTMIMKKEKNAPKFRK